MNPAKKDNYNELATRNIHTLTCAHKLLVDELTRIGRTEKLSKAYGNLDEAFYAAIRAESERIVLDDETSRELSRNTVTPESRVTEQVGRNTVTQ